MENNNKNVLNSQPLDIGNTKKSKCARTAICAVGATAVVAPTVL